MGIASSKALAKLKRKPWLFAYGLRGLWGGLRCRVWHGWICRRIVAGSMFRVYGKVHIIGPGKVIIGNDVHILGDVIKPASFLMTDPKARIVIGDHTGINGATFAAQSSIEVGRNCVIAAHYITDNQNHSLNTDRMENEDAPIEAALVRIEDNVWIAALTVVAHGVVIGENSVIGACSLVRENVPRNTLAAGNPLKIIRQLSSTANSSDADYDK